MPSNAREYFWFILLRMMAGIDGIADDTFVRGGFLRRESQLGGGGIFFSSIDPQWIEFPKNIGAETRGVFARCNERQGTGAGNAVLN